MKNATVRDLRVTFPKVEKWLKAGESVRITKRNRVVGFLVPPERKEGVKMPDFASRMEFLFPSKFKGGDAMIQRLIEERD